MPRRRRKKIKHIKSNLSADELGHLISGYALDGPRPALGGIDRAGYSMPFNDDAHRKDCWEKNRRYILGLAGHRVKDPLFFWASTDDKGRRVYYPAGTKPAAEVDYS